MTSANDMNVRSSGDANFIARVMASPAIPLRTTINSAYFDFAPHLRSTTSREKLENFPSAHNSERRDCDNVDAEHN